MNLDISLLDHLQLQVKDGSHPPYPFVASGRDLKYHVGILANCDRRYSPERHESQNYRHLLDFQYYNQHICDR